MSMIEIAKVKRGVAQIPMVGGAIAFGYNNPTCNLKLSQQQAFLVVMGEIKDWSQLNCSKG